MTKLQRLPPVVVVVFGTLLDHLAATDWSAPRPD